MLLCAPRLLAQERGAIALGEAVAGLGVNTRVLMIGAHPDDEDTFLIAWLSRGRHVKTAYLSLTRGDGGQNVIGNELGEALGVVRTEELLAARRVDGALQYFTRAYDFGFSKDTADTFRHWQRDTLLGDVVRVVRAFRPHVIVAVFSGTPRDGHGQHQASGILARDAYDAAADTTRFPARHFGTAWAPLKFYRAARGSAAAGTVGMDVGEYSPLRGESFGEIAGRSRSQHKSQGFGALEHKGPIMNYVRREATRVNADTPAPQERSLFDGIDTTWNRLVAGATDGRVRAALAALPSAFAAVRAAYDPFEPASLIPPLVRAAQLVRAICPPPSSACARVVRDSLSVRREVLQPDLDASVDEARVRTVNALRLASGIELETLSLEHWALNEPVPVVATLYNRGRDTVAVSGGMATGMRPGLSLTRLVPPGGLIRDTLTARVDSIGQPWWLAGGRDGGMFRTRASTMAENQLPVYPAVWYRVDLGGSASGEEVVVGGPAELRFADDVKGEVRRPAGGVPAITVTLEQDLQYAPANTPLDRVVSVRVRSAVLDSITARVSLSLPQGLRTDSAVRQLTFREYDEEHALTFRVRGQLGEGTHRVTASVESRGAVFSTGYVSVDYDHITRRRVFRPAATTIRAVAVRAPANLRVAYVTGVSDNVAPMLAQLGIPVTVIAAADVAGTGLAGYTTVVVGPRAYEAHPALAAANAKLLEFARNGGTLVVQYGQYELTQPGIMPFPITISRPHDRVTHENAPVTILDSTHAVLRWPNQIASADFDGWVQERSLYMPRTFDARYHPLLSLNDPGDEPNRGGILVTPLGRGTYVYTSLAFFRQLPAGVPGAARLFVNLLSAGRQPAGAAR